MEKEKKTFKEVLLDLASRYNIELPAFKDSKKSEFIKNFNYLKDKKEKIWIDEIDENLNFIFRKEIEKVFFEGVCFPYQVIP